MKKLLGLVAAATVAVALAAPAKASLITLSGGTAGTIPNGASNELLNPLFGVPSASGYYGSQINVSVPVTSNILFEFYGAEAGYHNEFNVSGLGELFDHPGGTIIAPNLGSPLATFATTILGTGLLPFIFDINNDALHLVNGFNPDDSGGAALGPNFFASCAPLGPGNPISCDSVYLFLDDGGAGPDDNHDDFLVRVTISNIPEPSSLALFGAGLLGIGLFRRRFRK